MLYLFVDTNFFLQCKDAWELSWKDIFNEDVIIHIPRAVIKELDNWKDKGNQRRARRARKALEIIDSLTNDEVFKVEHQALGVCFKAHKRLDLSSKREETLDLTKPDDSIVNEVMAWKAENPDQLVKVLTGDSLLRSTCKHCDVGFIAIPDDWRLPPETDEKDKKITKLKEALNAYQNSNPNLDIVASTPYEMRGNYLSLTIPVFRPMEERQVQRIASDILASFPMKTDFHSQKEHTNDSLTPLSVLADLLALGGPVSQNKINDYKNQYASWEKEVFEFLQQIHLIAKYRFLKKGEPHLTFSLSNSGGAPAEDLIVKFSISDTPNLAFIVGLEDLENSIRNVPFPPVPPSKGDWLRDIQAAQSAMSAADAASALFSRKTPKRDATAFYKRNSKGCFLCYECDQFRHHEKEKSFDIYFLPPHDSEGALNTTFTCKVSAKNVPVPVEKEIVVNLTFEIESLDETLNWFIEQLKSA